MGELSLASIKIEEARQLSLLPEVPELEQIAQGWPIPSGKILSKDEELCNEIAERALTGDSDRLIAKELRINRRSVKAVIKVMTANGKLAPLKERLLAGLGDVASLSLSRMKEALEDDMVPPAALPIYAGVAIDKRELLAGGATVRVEGRAVVDVAASFEALRALAATAPERLLESGSSGFGLKGSQIIDIAAVDTVRDTETAVGSGQKGGQAEGGGPPPGILAAGGQGDGLGGGKLSGKGGS